MGFDHNFRVLRSIVPDPQDPEKDIYKDFKIFAQYLQCSEVLRVLISPEDGEPSGYHSDDGVIPLQGESADDVNLLVRWLQRDRGFQLGVENVRQLLRMADKFEIPYLLHEIKIFSAHWITLVNPSYELWELAARFELEPLEKYCRLAARGRADAILSKGEGVKYFLDRQIPCYMIDRIIRALFAARESVIQTDYKGNRVVYL